MRNRNGVISTRHNQEILIGVAALAVYLAVFVIYANTAIAHTYPTGHTNLWFGLLHGVFLVPSFVMSWLVHDVTIYQSPNDGFWYNLGFVAGAVGLWRLVR